MAREALILGASSESLHAIAIAKKRGFHITALDGSPSAPGLFAADESAVIDISNPDAIMAYLKNRNVEIILPVPIGRVLITTGVINDLLGLPGVPGATADYCSDKYSFACGLSAKGLRDSKCLLAQEVIAEPELLNSLHFPVIVKPRFGSGSRGVRLVNSETGLVDSLSVNDIVEECYPGIEYGMDGVVKDGNLLVLMMRKKVNTKPPARQCIGYLTLPRGDSIYAIVEPYMQSVVSEIGLSDGLLHADIMVDNGKPFVIEVSARPSGHSISGELVSLATGLDPLDVFLDCCLFGKELPTKPEVKSLYLGFFDFGAGKVLSCPEPNYLKDKYGLIKYVQNFKTGDVFNNTVDGTVTERGRFIIKADTESPLHVASSLLNEFEIGRNDEGSL